MLEIDDSRVVRVRYPSHRGQVRVARRQVERAASEWGLSANAVSDLVLVASELVTNAVVHARTARGRQVGVTLRLLADTVRVEVRDADPGFPVTRLRGLGDQPTEFGERGRGLLLVRNLSLSCGVTTHVVGKTVWAEIARGATT